MTGPYRRVTTRVTTIGILALTARSLGAQSSWCEFRPGTLQSILSTYRSEVIDTLRPEQRNDVVSATTVPVRATLTYLGDSRRLVPADSAYLDHYFFNLHRVASDSALRALFHLELRFAEPGDTLWLPVQDSLIPALRQEAKAGDRVTLFARWLGLHQEGQQVTWVFVVNEFATRASDSSWNRFLSSRCPPS